MSDVRDPQTDQVLPTANDRPFIQNLVIADIEKRKEFGLKKYGTLLQSGNGRDMLQDAYEEALDLVIYLRGMIDERERDQMDRRCKVYLSANEVSKSLGLPAGVKVVGFNASTDPVALTLLLSGDRCEPVPENAEAPYVTLDFFRNED